jgi:hypothetical protein
LRASVDKYSLFSVRKYMEFRVGRQCKFSPSYDEAG